MKIKGLTKKLIAGYSKHSFELVDKTKLTRFKEIFEEYNLALL